MFSKLKTIAILGANGIMGALTGGLFAQSGYNTYFVARTKEKAQEGLFKAISQARSEIITSKIVCIDYSEFFQNIHNCDMIIECISENINIKKEIYEQIDYKRKPNTITCTMTSSIPLDILCEDRSFDFKRCFLGFHLFNPPTKLLLCELSSHKTTDPAIFDFVYSLAKNKLNRVVVPVFPTPAYAGNKIGFMVMSTATNLVDQMGVQLVDYLIGSYTGRLLSPLTTIDLVGLDIHRSILESINTYCNEENSSLFKLPEYINTLIDMGHLGNKTPEKGGFYHKDFSGRHSALNLNSMSYEYMHSPSIPFVENSKQCIHEGKYYDAFQIIKDDKTNEADILRELLCRYIAYSFDCIGVVTDKSLGIDPIDKIMASGFGWAPPSILLKVMGGKKEIENMLHHYKIAIPTHFKKYKDNTIFQPENGKYFIAK